MLFSSFCTLSFTRPNIIRLLRLFRFRFTLYLFVLTFALRGLCVCVCGLSGESEVSNKSKYNYSECFSSRFTAQHHSPPSILARKLAGATEIFRTDKCKYISKQIIWKIFLTISHQGVKYLRILFLARRQ